MVVIDKSRRPQRFGSSNSNNSSKTNPTSNVSSSSTTSSAMTGIPTKSKPPKPKKPKSSRSKKRKTSKLPPQTPEPDPLRQRAQSAPVDLDDLSDTLRRSHEGENSLSHLQSLSISPADTFETAPLSASSSRSFDSRASYQSRNKGSKRGGKRGDDRSIDSHNNDYLPVSLLNFDSPQNKKRGNNHSNSNGNNDSKVVIEHKMMNVPSNKNQFRSQSVLFGGGSSLACLLKPLLLFLFLAAILSGGASVYGWLFKFPALNQQVEALEEQVSRLQTENDRYENLNNRLNITVDDLETVKDDLNGTVSELETVASALNTTKDQIVAEIDQLKTQNFDYALLNEGLQAETAELAREVDSFREALGQLTDEHSILQNTTTALQDLATRFANTTIDQNETLEVLKITLEGFQAENDRLEDFNEKLETGLGYLNDTLFANGNLVESSAVTLGEITQVLGEQVKQQQRTTLQQLEISYRQLLAGWDCDYRDVFRSEAYGLDYDTLLVSESWGGLLPLEVQTYVEERVLSKLCLDPKDFQTYLFSTNADGVTSNQLIRAVVLYTEDAMQYYFESSLAESNSDGENTSTGEDNPNGVTLSQWIDVSFRCDRLESPFDSTKYEINVRKQRFLHLRH